ncbi:uncharacterized protein LOC113874188 [Abrus precatorius]|uniref:Uncharacterized protein LOC113874188 n=1 Tax=Abrus precatorius TaxID=3816 RepID=A0A8B8MJX9_ABRPR|nr:uncharacterized protein LOC113874188 [Abrus precatorius]
MKKYSFKGLLLRRKKEHAINLCEGKEPVNVRPYRYPYCHKAEIEKQVKEMLNSVSHKGVAMDSAKFKVLSNGLYLQMLKEFEVFGVTGYYCQFIQNYSKIARPLTKLTKKDGFPWNPNAQVAFELLKQKLTTESVLALPDFSQPFSIECDASG